MSCDNPNCACHHMSDEDIAEYMAQVRAATTHSTPTLWWLSFANQDGFQGIILLDVPAGSNPQDTLTALEKAQAFEMVGEVQAMLVPDDINVYPAEFRNRRLTREEAMKLGGVSTLETQAQDAQFEKNMTNPTIQ